MQPLEVQLMGGFSIRAGGQDACGQVGRAHQVWAILAALLLERGRSVPMEELADRLWREPPPNMPNSLKAVLHRTRARLDGLWEGAGRELILFREGGYAWNDQVPVSVDFEQFRALCLEAEKDLSQEERVEMELQALALYKGGFLPPLRELPWAETIAAQCRGLYVSHLLLALPVLEKQERWEEICALCQDAEAWEPYLMEVYRTHMAALIRRKDPAEAIVLYEEARETLLTGPGLLPSDEMDAMYRKALHGMNARALPMDALMEQLQEGPGLTGGLVCDYGIFKALCHSMARGILRGGRACVALLTLSGEDGGELPPRSLECAVSNLQDVIRESLRQGDTLARCGASQFVLLLPQADPNGCKIVCGRIQKAFRRQFPHSPARLHSAVHPLEPRK